MTVKYAEWLTLLLAFSPAVAHAADIAKTAPKIFSPGVISAASNDADATFTPDGQTVVFSRDGALMISDQAGGAWTTPRLAPFSGQWMDMQPAFSPDGLYLVFVSNRPLHPSDPDHPRGNLWRVARQAKAWGEPERLPATINADQSTWGPSVAADGSLFFMRRPDPKAPWGIWKSTYAGGTYQAAVEQIFGDATMQNVDPAVAPDQSFIVFSAKHPAVDAHEHLYIAFQDEGTWATPIDLGASVNGDGGNDVNEARLGPDGTTLYFSTDRTVAVAYPRTPLQAKADLRRIQAWDNGDTNIWFVSLAPWVSTSHPTE